jgi:hypothetical protein
MRQRLTLTFIVVAAISLLYSCKKTDWFFKKAKHKAFYAIFSDCSVKRVYGPVPEVGTVEDFNKEYDAEGLVSSLRFPVLMGGRVDRWHTFTLQYRPESYRVDFYNEASALAFQVFFTYDGRIREAKGSTGFDPSTFADLRFEYSGGRLSKIYRSMPGLPVNIQTFTYNSDGNIIKSVELDEGLTNEEDASYRVFLTYGAAAHDKRQFYTEYNNAGFTGTSLAILEYLGWIEEFYPKNLLVRTDFLWTPDQGGGGDITGHVFDSEGKLINWGGTVNLEWYCPTGKRK